MKMFEHIALVHGSEFNHFTGDFDLLERKCLKGFFWLFFDMVRNFLSKFLSLMTSQKKGLLHFMMHRDVLLKKCVLHVFC
jgi:hypothetical protein